MFRSTGDHHQGYTAAAIYSYYSRVMLATWACGGVLSSCTKCSAHPYGCRVATDLFACVVEPRRTAVRLGSTTQANKSAATRHPYGRALHVVQEDNTRPHAHVANITLL